MVKMNNSELYQQYIINYLNDIEQEMNRCEIELGKQYQICPITILSLDQIDHCLKEFIGCQRKYLSTRNNNQVTKFKNDIDQKELLRIISAYRFTIDQVSVDSFY